RFDEIPGHVQSAVAVLDEFKGSDILVMLVGDVLGIVEYFVIVSASNSRLVRKLVDEVEDRLKSEYNEPPLRIEGHDTFQWVLIDYGDFVVHVMLDETRRLYELERLWSDVPVYRSPAG
ncbi:MAG: ribosome silencing factor, partial [Acidimicrobiales bacterium]